MSAFPALAIAIVLDGRQKYRIAAAADVVPGTLSGILTGRIAPSAAQRQRIAAALGKSESELFAPARVSA